jgi:hypothetical protein
MKRIIRLTESDLTRLVKRIIRESNESKPKKIEIKFLPGWEERLEEMTDDNLKGHTPMGSTVTLEANDGGKKIGYGPYIMRDNSRDFFYGEYRPQHNEITVSGYRCFGNDAIGRAEDNYNPPIFLTRDDLRPEESLDKQDKYKRNYCVGGVGEFYSKFDSFDIGESDHRDYFEIVATDGEYQQKEEEQLSERYFRRKRRY